ncbi:hypothetical protein [Emticicia sp. C21]|uniref:hypothetical protein n=1 Tax=Emticicia sp. C21 TaxID=2302915 RepID=UPI000E3528A6|nr:hypothetical protein [Emticicia sp. C21]RFS17681.1 hypothetical protein D0T08_00035 [Emticicia sp. C21]
MKPVLGIILYMSFAYCEIVAWGFVALLLNTAFISADTLLSPDAMFELYTGAPENYILSRLSINIVISLAFGLFLSFQYWLIRRFYMLPETIIEQIDARSFFKWQTIALFCFGLGAIVWGIYKIYHPYPEVW